MFTHNDQTKARFPLSLDGRGARGEGVLRYAKTSRSLAALLLPLAVLLVPNTALADDECGLQILPGTAETVTCNPGDYPNGITYASDGDLTLEVPDDTTHLTVNTDGVNVTGNGTDSVSWDSTVFTSRNIIGNGGSVLDYSSGTGNIDILIGGRIQAQTGATHAVNALSGSGNIVIETNRVDGQQYGIQAETGGAGTVEITALGQMGINSTVGVAAIDATTGTGNLVIDVPSVGSSNTINGQSGSAIRINAGGDAEINIGDGRTVTNNFATPLGALELTAAGEVVVNNDGSLNGGFRATAIRASGGVFVLNNDGTVTGAFDLSSLTGGYTINNNAGALWDAVQETISNLGAGDINNAGTIEVSNAGSVIQGEPFGPNRISAPGATYTGTAGSVLNLEVFLDGSGQPACDENIEVGACLDLSGGATAGQTALLVDGNTTTLVSGPLTAVTSANPGIVLVDVSGGTSGADHFVLHPDSCLFTAGSVGCQTVYETDPIYGAVMDVGGVLDYALLYNPDTQQHLLASVPSPQAVEYAFFIDEMLSVWHITSETVAGRQAELRDGATGRLWFRAVGQESERDAAPTSTIQGNTFTYDRGYSLSTQELMVGADLISGENHVFGLHVGVVTAKLEFDDSETYDDVDGANFGAYGGWWHDSGLSLDGAVTATFLKLEHDIAGDFEKTEIDTLTAGARLEAGWRLPLMERALYVQPLATAVYARSDIDNVELQDNEVSFKDSNSMRTGLGARLGGETALDGDKVGKLGYWLTARHWEEHESDGRVEFATQGGQPLAIEDDLSGSYEQVDLGVSVSNADDTLSGFLSGGAQFADDKLGDSYNVSVGVRMNW